MTVTAVKIDAAGNYSQHHLGEFPELLDLDGKRLRFGANAEFFAAAGIDAFENGVINLDDLQGETTLGYIFGGLTANGPHTRGVADVISAATNKMFEVVLVPVPEPSSLALISCGILALLGRRRGFRGIRVSEKKSQTVLHSRISFETPFPRLGRLARERKNGIFLSSAKSITTSEGVPKLILALSKEPSR